MANENEKKEKEVRIIVNGTEHKVEKGVLSFNEVTQIAFPGHPTDPNVVFSVTYDKANQKPDHGSLLPGQSVEVKNHTVFDVTQTNRS